MKDAFKIACVCLTYAIFLFYTLHLMDAFVSTTLASFSGIRVFSFESNVKESNRYFLFEEWNL